MGEKDSSNDAEAEPRCSVHVRPMMQLSCHSNLERCGTRLYVRCEYANRGELPADAVIPPVEFLPIGNVDKVEKDVFRARFFV